jgi:hypothetical protein
VHQLHAHHQVIIKKFRRVLAVGANATHMRRQVDDNVRSGVCQQAPDGFRLDQIVLLIGRDKNVPGPAAPEIFDHERSQESGASGYANAFAAPKTGVCAVFRHKTSRFTLSQ